MLKNITWATGFATGLLAVLTIWLPAKEAAEFALTLYLIYLTGFFFLKNFYTGGIIEQNTLSVVVGIILLSAGTYALTLLRITYTKTALLILTGSIIAASALLERLTKRKTRAGPKRKPK